MAAAINTPVIMTDVHDMDFGNIAPRGNSGTVVMSPGANAQCNTTGGVIHTGTCRAATFEGKVTFLFGLRVTGPTGNQINLSGPGGATMRLDNFTFGSGPGMLDFGVAGGSHRFWILNLDGSYTIHAGGTLHVAANQTPGVYTGTFDIRLNYD
ncbi:DUF4402 domain-containing protein [Croceibacterium aestuarii]|uniref:DUF4402 domain-containing protein n=1 Tax=Croceibacterium aestuarii TaxID=3064139 RepID=UPI00272E6293|nr:DUF4402 domain-containing protein [Croceibacterium sp. D39]